MDVTMEFKPRGVPIGLKLRVVTLELNEEVQLLKVMAMNRIGLVYQVHYHFCSLKIHIIVCLTFLRACNIQR